MRFSCLRTTALHVMFAGVIALPALANADGLIRPDTQEPGTPAATTGASAVVASAGVQPQAAMPAAPPSAPLLEHLPSERLSKAMGNFSRAHRLLVSAIEEFDRGYQLADPSSMMDVQQFRGNLIDRASDLEHLLDPQPRISKSGVRYQGDSRLLNQEKK